MDNIDFDQTARVHRLFESALGAHVRRPVFSRGGSYIKETDSGVNVINAFVRITVTVLFQMEALFLFSGVLLFQIFSFAFL